jgi:hypothetical protein
MLVSFKTHFLLFLNQYCVVVITAESSPIPSSSRGAVDMIKHTVTFFDSDFKKIYSFDLDPLEQGLSITCTDFSDQIGSAGSRIRNKEYFVVGTAYVVPEEMEPSKGRILVFKANRRDDCAALDGGQNSVAVNYDELGASSLRQGFEGATSSSEVFDVFLVTQRPAKGAVFSLSLQKGKLFAAIGSKVRFCHLMHLLP